MEWSKSSYSVEGNCVEVADMDGEVLVRDGNDPDGPVLRFTPDEWVDFIKGVKAKEFDL